MILCAKDLQKNYQTPNPLFPKRNKTMNFLTGSKCADKMSDCERHKSFCDKDNIFGRTMRGNCPKTCNLCKFTQLFILLFFVDSKF